jgi:hypothetical protein
MVLSCASSHGGGFCTVLIVYLALEEMMHEIDLYIRTLIMIHDGVCIISLHSDINFS